MGGALVFMDPSDPSKLNKDPNVWIILCRGALDRFIEACEAGSDQRLANYVVNTWDNGVCKSHGRGIHFSESSIA